MIMLLPSDEKDSALNAVMLIGLAKRVLGYPDCVGIAGLRFDHLPLQGRPARHLKNLSLISRKMWLTSA
jgi:hypothetical protein